MIDTPKGAWWMDASAATIAPAPDSGALEWAAWPISYIRGEPFCDYIVRTDTTGGASA